MQETFSYKIPESFRSDIEFAVEPDIVGDMPKYDIYYATSVFRLITKKILIKKFN